MKSTVKLFSLGRVHNLPRGGAMVILRGGHHFLTLQ